MPFVQSPWGESFYFAKEKNIDGSLNVTKPWDNWPLP
jgi:hypothetical protein